MTRQGDGNGDEKPDLREEPVPRALLERLPAIVYTSEIGPTAPWRYVSPRIKDILGFTPEEWLADPKLWVRQIHPDDRERVLNAERSVTSAPAVIDPIDYRMLTRSGQVIWVLDDATVEPDYDGVPVWHGVMYDITFRKETERALEQLATQQASLAELGEQALAGADLNHLISAAIELVMAGGATHAAVWERPPHGGGLRLRAGLQRVPGQLTDRVSASPDSHAGAAMRLGQPVVVNDWQVDERFEMPPALRALGIRSSVTVVIEGHSEPFGVLDVHSEAPDQFREADIHLAQSAANVLSGAIQRLSADEEMRYSILHDPLTGLPNRQLFMDLLSTAWSRAKQNDTPIAVLFLDLDHFKLINDSLGHHVGDELLRIIAPRLAGRLRPADTVARFGGDEFGMLIEDLTDEAEAVAISERIGRALSRPVTIEGIDHFVTASIGIAVADPRSTKAVDAESLVRDADAAMYRAKERGRARYQLFGEEMRAHAIRRLETQRKLRRALEKDELVVRYQPVVSLTSGQIVGTEALIRWRHPQRGLLSPQEFISVAEESGLIGNIGKWVLEQAVEQTLSWHESRPDERPINIAVNISPWQVTQSDMVSSIRDLLVRTGIDPAILFLEITESVLVEESALVSETLEGLSELGVRLVLDDFGTGYSSLGYLNRFPLSALKIDRSFIERLGGRDGSGGGNAIVEAILAMARALSLEVIAEGVSESVQAGMLKEMDCQFAQGFLFARPLPPEDVSFLLDHPEKIAEMVDNLR